MRKPDNLLNILEDIYTMFGQFCRKRGAVSEADTRHQILDRILHEVLLWPRNEVKCEERTDVGFMDYTLYSANRPLVVVEAKKVGESWHIPHPKLQKQTYQLSGVIQKEKDVDNTIIQVQSYCNAHGVRYAIASNGYSFIIFRAISERIPWREGIAYVFSGPKAVMEHFNVFLDMLLYENLVQGSLDNIFIPQIGLERIYDKPLSHITNEDALYGRNIISSLLHPYIETFFGDISSQSSDRVFESCYVYSQSLRQMDTNLTSIIKDEIPQYAEKDGFQELILSKDGGELAKRIKETPKRRLIGNSILLMGGIGCGKSTYLRRLIRLLSREQFSERTLFIYIDYLGYAPDLIDLKEFTYQIIADNLKSHKSIILRDVLELIYRDEIEILKQTKLFSIKDVDRLSEKIGEFLYQKIQDNIDFSEKTIKALLSADILPIIIFDNVDQLSLSTQIEIFTTSQYFSRQVNCFTILALREESYCTARMQKVFTAYAIQKYHISSPNFRKMIKLRIANSLKEISGNEIPPIYISNRKVTKDDLINFLQVVHDNLFRPYKPIMRLIEAISFGDMRFALNLLNTFMTSGTTDVGKILIIQMKDGDYTVAFHEFIKSITLGEFRYYKENRSFIINIYDIKPEHNSSHFTGLRLLRYLAENKNISSPEGIGFVELNTVLRTFEDIFHNENDVIKTILKFISLNRQLVELDTRMTESIEGSSYVRITPAGLFYLDHLYKVFPYLDLIWQDTPINDSVISQELAKLIHVTDMEERFKRVSVFLEYLDREEANEIEHFGIKAIDSPITRPITTEIKKSFVRQCGYIRSKRSNL